MENGFIVLIFLIIEIPPYLMPEMKHDRQAAHRLYSLAVIQNSDAEIVVFNGVLKVLVITVHAHEQILIEAAITPPDAVVRYSVPVKQLPEKSVFNLDSLFDLAGSTEERLESKFSVERINYPFFGKQPLGKFFPEFDAFASQDCRGVAIFHVGPYKMAMSNTIGVGKDQVVPGGFMGRFIQNAGPPETGIFLPDMLNGKLMFKLLSHLRNKHSRFIGTPVVCDKNLGRQHALFGQTHKGEFKISWFVIGSKDY
jgi:hypothetical protein